MSKGRIIITLGDYDTLNDFSYQLIDIFNDMGYEVMAFDARDMLNSLSKLSDFVKERVLCVITFNNLCYNLELTQGKNTWETLGIYIIDILMDHPFCYKKAMENAPSNMIVLCPDKNHMRYIQRFYPHINTVGFLAHAGKEVEEKILPIKNRTIDILYAGGLSKDQIEFVKPNFSEYKFDLERICDNAIKSLIDNPSITTEDAIENELIKAGVNLSDDQLKDLITACRFVDMSAVSYYREKCVEVLVDAGLEVTIYGGGWENCEWINKPNAHYMGRIDAKSVVDKMQDAKIVLNTMTWFKDGTHDRIFNGMLAGAAVATDSSLYIKEEFNEQELLIFELNELENLPSKIDGLLNDENRIQSLADTGRKRAMVDQTWKVRARELEEDLFIYLQ